MNDIDLAFINKYVGYRRKKSKVTLEKTKAKVYKLDLISKQMLQLNFFVTEITLDRITGDFKVRDKRLMAKEVNVARVNREDLLLVRIPAMSYGTDLDKAIKNLNKELFREEEA